MSDLYTAPFLVYDEPPQIFSAQVSYTVWSPEGQPVARVQEAGVGAVRQAWRIMHQDRGDQARRDLYVSRYDGMPYFSVHKPYAWAGTPEADVVTPYGQLIGHLRKRAFSGFEILDAQRRQIGYFDFYRQMVLDWQNYQVATFQRMVNGVGQLFEQAFTGAHRYSLQFHVQLPEPMHTLVLACPLIYDVSRGQNRIDLL